MTASQNERELSRRRFLFLMGAAGALASFERLARRFGSSKSPRKPSRRAPTESQKGQTLGDFVKSIDPNGPYLLERREPLETTALDNGDSQVQIHNFNTRLVVDRVEAQKVFSVLTSSAFLEKLLGFLILLPGVSEQIKIEPAVAPTTRQDVYLIPDSFHLPASFYDRYGALGYTSLNDSTGTAVTLIRTAKKPSLGQYSIFITGNAESEVAKWLLFREIATQYVGIDGEFRSRLLAYDAISYLSTSRTEGTNLNDFSNQAPIAMATSFSPELESKLPGIFAVLPRIERAPIRRSLR